MTKERKNHHDLDQKSDHLRSTKDKEKVVAIATGQVPSYRSLTIEVGKFGQLVSSRKSTSLSSRTFKAGHLGNRLLPFISRSRGDLNKRISDLEKSDRNLPSTPLR